MGAESWGRCNDRERILRKMTEREGVPARTGLGFAMLCVPFSAVGTQGNGKTRTPFTDYKTLLHPLSGFIVIKAPEAGILPSAS